MVGDAKLKSCPWCAKPLTLGGGMANPYGICRTGGCFGGRLPVVSFDDPYMVEQYNRRAGWAAMAWHPIETAPTPHGYIDGYPSFYLGRPTIWVRYAHDEGPPIALIYGHLDLDGSAWIAEKWMPAPGLPIGGAA